ncbi:MAG: ParB N-terminal domain-containing protein [Acidimicrobiales bacterium]
MTATNLGPEKMIPGIAPARFWGKMPEISDEEYAALKADVAERGILVPIVLHPLSGQVLEGHHQLRAWFELRDEGVPVDPYPQTFLKLADDEPRDVVAMWRRQEAEEREATERRCWELVVELATSGVALADPHLDYVEVQIDRSTWEQLQAEVARMQS